MKNINLKQTKKSKKIIFSVILSILAISQLLVSTPLRANFPLNEAQCDQVIKNTHYNPSARTPATIYNTQVCLSRAGFFNHNGKFTSNYGSITRQASTNYINNLQTEEVKVVPIAPTPAPTLIKPEEKVLTPMVVTPVVVITDPEPVPNIPTPSTEVLNNDQNRTVKAETMNNTDKIDKTDKTVTEPTLSNAKKMEEISKSEPKKEEGTKPILFRDFIFNSLYLIFALPFLLFAIAIILAFRNVFKKNAIKKI